MRKVFNRLERLEDDHAPDKPYKFFTVWINSHTLPRLHNSFHTPVGFFESVEQYLEFKDQAESKRNMNIVVFPMHWAGEADPLPEDAKMISGWSDNF